MANNPYVNKVQLANGTTLIDLSGDTVTSAADIVAGKIGHLASGEQVTGTASGGGGGTGGITQDQDGYIVLDPNGGSTTWETVYQDNVTISDWGDPEYYVLISGFVSSYGDLIVGDTYRVTWNGVPYECDAFAGSILSSDVTPCIGDETLTDEPFAGQRNVSGDLIFITYDSPGVFALKIEHKVSGGGGGSTLVPKSITANGTYDPEDDDADGYSEVTVNVPPTVPNLQAKTNVSPTTSSQTIQPDSGYDGLSSVQINAMPSGTAGTPTATKGTVSNHSVSITPSVTNTTGYITGSTKTGTAVTVNVTELESGTKSITANGTGISVSGYSTVDVAVPSSGGKNCQIAHGTKRVASQTYTDVGYEITVAKTGTYNVYWAGWRSSTSGTNGAQLYVNGNASGDAVTTFDGTWTNVQNGSRTSVSLTQNDKVTLRARSRGTSYQMYIFFLSIEEV